jgi:protein-S-isoprenylcysteine O-methyltransferase Ste14
MVYSRTHFDNRFAQQDHVVGPYRHISDERGDELAPLAPLAVIVSFALVTMGCIATPAMGEWTRDYGAELVVIAFCLHMFLSALLGSWGLREWLHTTRILSRIERRSLRD